MFESADDGVTTDTTAADQWREDRTTFQRVYDLIVGSLTVLTAQEVAERADCSEPGQGGTRTAVGDGHRGAA